VVETQLVGKVLAVPLGGGPQVGEPPPTASTAKPVTTGSAPPPCFVALRLNEKLFPAATDWNPVVGNLGGL